MTTENPAETQPSDDQPRRRLVLHAGTTRNGSASVQAALGQHQTALDSDGVYVLRSNRRDADVAKATIAWNREDDPSWQALREELETVKNLPHHTIVLSEQSAHSTGPRGLRRLREAFADFDVHVVMYVEDQAEFAQSLVLHYIKTGREVIDVRNVDERRHAITGPRLDYLEMANRHNDVFDKVELRVVDADALYGGHEAADFLHLLGATEAADSTEPLEGGNDITAGFAAVLFDLEREGSELPQREVRKAAKRLSSKGHGSKYFLTEDEVNELRAHFEVANQQLVAEFVTNADALATPDAWAGEDIDTDHFRELLMERLEQ